MTWFKVDDKLHTHVKAMRAGLDAMGLWALAGSYCAGHENGGVVEREQVSRLSGRRGPELARRLVEAGLWKLHALGWEFHDWGSYQPSKETLAAKRRSGAERVARWNGKRAASAVTDAATNGVSDAVSDALVTHGTPVSSRPDPSRPDPLPTEEVSIRAPRSRSPKAPKVKPPEPAPHADYPKVIDCYFKAFERARGAKPKWTDRIGKAAKELLVTMSGDEACEVIETAFRDDWFVRTSGELHAIAKEPNKFRGTPSRPSGVVPIGRQRTLVQPGDPKAPWLQPGYGTNLEFLEDKNAKAR